MYPQVSAYNTFFYQYHEVLLLINAVTQNTISSVSIKTFHVLDSKRLKSCRCWPKPHACLLSSNEVVTCTPGKQIDTRTVCCKVKESKQEQAVRESEMIKKERRISNLPDKHFVLNHKLRWLRNKRLGQFVAFGSTFLFIRI